MTLPIVRSRSGKIHYWEVPVGRILFRFSAAVSMLFALTAAGFAQGAATAPKDIVIANNANFVSLDPQDTNDNISFSAEKAIYQGLLGFDKDMKLVGVLATDWVASPNAKKFTFHLRKGVSFQDGTPFDAAAVKVNIDRLADPANKLKRHSLFDQVEKTVVDNEYTVSVYLKAPFGAMLNNFSHPGAMMISPKALQDYGKDIFKHPVGTGPYLFKDWVTGDHLTLVKNPNYWGGPVNYNSITFRSIPEDGTRVAMLQSGEADFIYPVPTEQLQVLAGQGGIVVKHDPTVGIQYASMNTMKKPFTDVRVRQALNYAVDKDAFIKVVFNGIAGTATSCLAPNTRFYSPQTPYPYDPAKAKKLLAEAGYPNGFETTLWVGTMSVSIKAAQFLQQQLAMVGVNMKIESLESGTMANKIWNVADPKDATIQMYYGSWTPSTADADWGMRPILGGTMIPPKGYNTAYFQNKEVNADIQAGLDSADVATRKAAYEKAQKTIWNEAPWIFLSVPQNIYAYKDSLQDVNLLPDGTLSVYSLN